MQTYRLKWFIIFGCMWNFFLIEVSQAQLKKNDLFLHGSASLTQSFYDGNNIGFHILLEPSAGMFFTDNLAVQSSLSFSTFYFDKQWQSSGLFGIGLLAACKLTSAMNYYIGCQPTFDNFQLPNAIQFESGTFLGIKDNIYLDIGLDYLLGIGENKYSTISLHIGILSVL